VTEKDLHYYEPKNGHGLKHDPFNAIIAPRPIGWISRATARATSIWRPTAFSTPSAITPPIIGFSSTNWKDSAGNIQDTGEFVWNLATMDLAQQMNATAAHVARDVDEFQIAGPYGRSRQARQRAPRRRKPGCLRVQADTDHPVAGRRRRQGAGVADAGEVVAVHIDKAFIKDGVYQTGLAHPIVRAGRRGDYFEIKPENMFEMIRPD
jgi:flavin reductase (DIM6/NTAB) family NADH-FMN oxidoreductase RutF